MPSESKERKMMLVWLLGFSLLCLALTKPVRAGSRVHQTKVQCLRKWISILRAINPDVGEAKIQKKILSSSQPIPREEENNIDGSSMSGPSGKKKRGKRTQTMMLRSNWSWPRGEENNMEDRRQSLTRASRNRESRRFQKKMLRTMWSNIEDRRCCLMSAQWKNEMSLRILKKNAMFSR